MNKFQKLVKGFAILLNHPSFINKLLNDNESWRKSFSKQYLRLVNGLPVIDLHQVINTQQIEINTYSYLNGGSLVTDLALLKGLAATINNCRYFEIGTWRGESVVNVAENALSCDTLNLSKQEMARLKVPSNIIDQIGLYIHHQPNIRQLEGNTSSFDFSELQKYDLLFIDGDHHYSSVFHDTQQVLSHLVHPQSIIVWHDYAYSPDNLRYEVFQAILDAVPIDLHPYLYHVRNTNCCVLLPEFKGTKMELQCPDKPYYNFKVHLAIEKTDLK